MALNATVEAGATFEPSVEMALAGSQLYSRYLVIGGSPKGILLTFEPAPELTLGSRRRAKEARQSVVSLLKRHGFKAMRDGEEIRAAVSLCALGNLPGLLSEIDAALDAFRKQRLHPRVVEEILGITSRERRRWTKDGRLPQSGTGSFGRGRQSIHFALHPAAKIAALARQPETIEAWRRKDESQSLSTKDQPFNSINDLLT